MRGGSETDDEPHRKSSMPDGGHHPQRQAARATGTEAKQPRPDMPTATPPQDTEAVSKQTDKTSRHHGSRTEPRERHPKQ